LGRVQNGLRRRQRAQNQPAFDGREALGGVAFDDPSTDSGQALNQMQVRPEAQARPAELAGVEGVAKDLADGLRPTGKAISHPQEGRVEGHGGPHLDHHLPHQRRVALDANGTLDEQTRKDTHRRRQPDRTVLCLDIECSGVPLVSANVWPHS
jgi:hypothetical protein